MIQFSDTLVGGCDMPGIPVLFVNGVKPCSVCGEKKPPEGFNRETASASGYASRCKACQRLYKLGRGETIHELREKVTGRKLAETAKRRAEREAEREAKKREAEAEGRSFIGRTPVSVKDGRKPCSTCGKNKPVSAFYRDRGTKSGYANSCIECRAKYRKTPEANRVFNLMNKYGMTIDEFDAMFEAQNGKCAICAETLILDGTQNGAHVDHDHVTGKIRGILCAPCNHGLGRFDDNPDRLIAAAAYLMQNVNLLKGQE